MLYLLLAVLSSTIIGVLMKSANSKIKDPTSMFMFNYITCMIFALIINFGKDLVPTTEKLGVSILLALITGFFYLTSFLVQQVNIKKNGIVLSSTFNKLGVIIPTLAAVFIFGETLGINKLIGCILAVLAIILINGDGKNEKEYDRKNSFYLILVLFTGGMCSIMSYLFSNLGNSSLKDLYLLLTFSTAFLMCVVILIQKKYVPCKEEIIYGVMIGVPNYFSARFLLASLKELDAVVVYPVNNVGALLLISLAGFLIYKEKLSNRKLIGMGIIIVSIILLNI